MVFSKGYQGVLRYRLKEPVWTKVAQAYRYALAGTRQKTPAYGSDDTPDAEDLKMMEQFARAPKRKDKERPSIRDFLLLHTSRIMEDHRAHLEALRKDRWPPLMVDKGWYRAINCPPVGVTTYGRSAQPPCHHRHLCPWCWCRAHVRETVLNVEYAIFGSNNTRDYNPRTGRKEENIPQGPWNLLVLERDYGAYQPDHMQAMWEDIRATRVLTPTFLRNQVGHVDGFYYLYVICPSDPRSEEDCFVLKKRILVLVDQMFDWAEGASRVEQYPDGRYAGELQCKKRCHELSRREIIGAVGMACRYPRQLLYGPVDLLQQLLEQKRRHFIPERERGKHLKKERAAELKKKLAYRDFDVLYGPARTYARNSGVRLSATSGLFRNRAARLRKVNHLNQGEEPTR